MSATSVADRFEVSTRTIERDLSALQHGQDVVVGRAQGDHHEHTHNPSTSSSTSIDLKRTPVNPWSWSLNFGYNQAETVEGASRQLNCAGQTAVDADGNPQHLDDMRGQMALALDNLEVVLSATDMSLANITRLSIFTTDMEETMQHFDVYGGRLGPLNAAPPMTLLGVTRLALPGLMFEIEATAAD